MHDTEAAAQPVMITIGATAMQLHLVEAGLACCAVEQSAATTLLGGLTRSGDGFDPEPGEPLQVLVVSGTVTDAMAPLLVAAFEAMPQPRAVLSFGACAATGGPYWDSYVVTNGIDQLLPVDVYVPGCPPTPAAFVEGLRVLVNAADSAAESPEGSP
jgi:NADH-quinone oxidoreductase subunit B